MATHDAFGDWNREVSASDDAESAGRALMSSLIAGREVQHAQQRFRSYLNAHAIASEMVYALSQNPGLREMDGRAVMTSMEQMVEATRKARRYLLGKLGEIGVDVENPNPAHLAQINRLVSEHVARNWSADPEQNAMFDIQPRNGERLSSFAGKMTLFTAYTDYVAKQIEREGLAGDAGPEFVSDYQLDRLLAAHSMYQRIDDVARSFATRYLDADRPAAFRELVLGADGSAPMSSDALTHKLVMDVVLPVVDDRHRAIFQVFDPLERFGARDRHVTYRSLMRMVSRDAALILAHEEDLFVERAKAIAGDPDACAERRAGDGVLVAWLRERLETRLDRLYPRPDEYAPTAASPEDGAATAQPDEGVDPSGKAQPDGAEQARPA